MPCFLSTMHEIPFISEESFNKGRELEKRLTDASSDIGIIFASVLPLPAPRGVSTWFTVVVGVSRNRTQEMVIPVVEMLFAKEKKDGSYFSIEVIRGTTGAAAHKAVPGPAASPS